MIKLFSLKQQKKDGEATPKSGPQKKAFTAAQLRITKGKHNPSSVEGEKCQKTFYFNTRSRFADINELNLPKTCATEFPDPDDLLNFKLIICPDEGFYKGGRFVFNFKVSASGRKISGSWLFEALEVLLEVSTQAEAAGDSC